MAMIIMEDVEVQVIWHRCQRKNPAWHDALRVNILHRRCVFVSFARWKSTVHFERESRWRRIPLDRRLQQLLLLLWPVMPN